MARRIALAAAFAAALAAPALAGAPGTVTSKAGQPIPAWAVTGNVGVQGDMFRDSFGSPVNPADITIAKPGHWGTGAVIKTGPTSNDQFDPYDPRDGSYTNTGGARDWTYTQRVGGKTLARIGVVDWGDRINGEKSKLTVTVRYAAGDTERIGTVGLRERLPSGAIMGVKVKTDRKIAAVRWHFTQQNPRDIVGVVNCNCKVAATVTKAKPSQKVGKAKAAKGRAAKAAKTGKAR